MSTLGEKVTETFTGAAMAAFETALKKISPNILAYIEQTVGLIENAPGSPSLKEMVDSGKLQEMFAQAMVSQEHHSAPILQSALVDAISAMGAILGAPLGLLPVMGDIYSAGWGEVLQSQAREVARPTYLQAAEAIQGYFRGAYDEAGLRKELAGLGYTDNRIDSLLTIMRPILDPDKLRQLELRGEAD